MKKKKIKSIFTKVEEEKIKPIKARRFDVEKEFEEEMKYFCPVRGWVTQLVKVKRLKSKSVDPNQIMSENNLFYKVEVKEKLKETLIEIEDSHDNVIGD